MISAALIFLSVILIIAAKMPLLGGKILRGGRVRFIGALTLAVSSCSFFLSKKLGMILNLFILAVISGVYFFARGEAPSIDEAKNMLFKSAKDEKKTYSSSAKGLIITILIMIVFGGGAWMLIKIIRGH